MKKLYRSNKNKMIAGVCGGVAECFNIDVTLVRLIFGVITIFWGTGIVVYILAAFVIPADSESSYDEDVDNLKSANIDDEDEIKDTKKKSSKNKSDDSLHTDQEFDSFFEK